MNKTGKEKLKQKWDATGLLNGLHLNNNINVNCCSTSYNTCGYLNTDSGARINTGTLTINPGTGIITTTPALGTLTIADDNDNCFIPQPGYSTYSTYSTFIDIPNENEFTIDVSKGLVKVYDFSKKLSTYFIKKFKSLLIKEEEHSVVCVERQLEPGELLKIQDYLDGELLLEFTEDLDDRYGEKCVLNKLRFQYSSEIFNNFPQVINVTGGLGLTTNGLVTVQSSSASTGQLVYTDYVYNNNINSNKLFYE